MTISGLVARLSNIAMSPLPGTTLPSQLPATDHKLLIVPFQTFGITSEKAQLVFPPKSILVVSAFKAEVPILLESLTLTATKNSVPSTCI